MDFNPDNNNTNSNDEWNSPGYGVPQGDPNVQPQADMGGQPQGYGVPQGDPNVQPQGYGAPQSEPYTYGQPQGDPYAYGQPQGYGQPYGSESIYAQPTGSDGKSIASMICGIAGLITCCCYGITAIILGIIAVVLATSVKKDYGDYDGMSQAGLITGIISIVLGVLYLILTIVLIATGIYEDMMSVSNAISLALL